MKNRIIRTNSLRDSAKDKRVKALREKGLTFTEIGKIMDFSKQVAYFRWKRVSRSYPQKIGVRQ